MVFIMESNDIYDYLKPDEYIDCDNPAVMQKADELFHPLTGDVDKIRRAFEYVRDDIRHSGDIGSERVTRTASEVLLHKEGICVAKALFLAALLRCAHIPAGLCYQRLTLGDTPDTGYVIHGLNAVFISDVISGEQKWLRLDARGNKPGVDAHFSVHEERIAYPARDECGEIDYPTIYALPHPLVTRALAGCKTRGDYGSAISAL